MEASWLRMEKVRARGPRNALNIGIKSRVSDFRTSDCVNLKEGIKSQDHSTSIKRWMGLH